MHFHGKNNLKLLLKYDKILPNLIIPISKKAKSNNLPA